MSTSNVKALTLLLALAATGPTLCVQADEFQSLDAIRQLAQEHALGLLQDKAFTELDVQAAALDSRLRLKPCDDALETFGASGSERSTRITVGIRCAGSTPWTLYVPVQVHASMAVVGVTHALPRGSVLSLDDLVIQSRPVQELPAQYLSDPSSALDMELTRAVTADTLLSPSLLKQPQLVSKGQQVTIVADGANFAVKMAGTALQNGSAGQLISVKNTTSGRTVQGVIVDAATIRVKL